jgi:hypothetical protein
MSQTFSTLQTTDTISAGRTIKNDNFAALRSSFSGTSAPTSPTPVEGQLFCKTDTNVLQIYTGSAWVTIIPDYTVGGGGLIATTGGIMSGALAMGSNAITGLGNGSASTDAVNKGQVDARLAAAPVTVSITGTANSLLWIAPAACTISDVLLVSSAATSGSNASNNWSFNVRNVTQSENLRSAGKSTNGAEIAAETAYALALDQNLTGIAQNDVLRLDVTQTGSPTSLSAARVVAVIRYSVTT